MARSLNPRVLDKSSLGKGHLPQSSARRCSARSPLEPLDQPLRATRILRYDAIQERKCRLGTRDRQDPLAAGDSKDVGGGTDRNEPDGVFYS